MLQGGLIQPNDHNDSPEEGYVVVERPSARRARARAPYVLRKGARG